MDVVVFSWGALDKNYGTHTAARVTKELARCGNTVLFVQPRGAAEIDVQGLPIQVVGLSDLGCDERNLRNAAHGLPVDCLTTVAKNLVSLIQALPERGKPPAAIWFHPFDHYIRLFPLLRGLGFITVYYCVDDFSSLFDLVTPKLWNLQAEEYIASHADLVVTLTTTVEAKLKPFARRIRSIPNGVDLAEFQPKAENLQPPPDLLRGERTLGFWGHLYPASVDPTVIAYVAAERPKWAINLIGPISGAATQTVADQMKGYPNVRFLGEVAHDRLRDYGAFFDAFLLPSPDSDFSRGRGPTKLFEYLAMHKPVICYHMPQLAGIPYVHVALTAPEFLRAIETALNTPVDPAVIDGYLAERSWPARGEALLKLIDEIPKDSLDEQKAAVANKPGAEQAESLVLPPFPRENIVWMQHISQLEDDLERVRRWARELEAAVQTKDRELQTIRGLPGLSLLGKIRRVLK